MASTINSPIAAENDRIRRLVFKAFLPLNPYTDVEMEMLLERGVEAERALQPSTVISLIEQAIGEPRAAKDLADEAWEDLVNVDDRTSPKEYPDMCLITRDELAEFMSRAARAQNSGEDLTVRQCFLCAGECRGHNLGDESQWTPEPGSQAYALSQQGEK